MGGLDVAIVGCGFVANDHLKAWDRVHKARVVAVCDVNEVVAKKTAKLWKIPKNYKSFSKMLEQRNIDVIDICTPPHTHASLAVQAMKSNFHVLVEKPMTMTAKDAEKIVKCQKVTGMKVGVIHNWLFEPPVLEATSLVDKGHLGEVINVEVEALKSKNDAMVVNEHHWCHKFPGGRFSEMLAHPIYLIRHFLGEPKASDVSVSKIGDYPWMKSDELCATFEARKGLGRAYASFNASRDTIFINLYGREAILKVDVVNATINMLPKREISRFNRGFDALRQASQLTKSTMKNVAKIAFGHWLSGHERYIEFFAENLMSDGEPPITAEDGYKTVKVLEDTCKRIVMAEQKDNRNADIDS